jgi:hypothetical protein
MDGGTDPRIQEQKDEVSGWAGQFQMCMGITWRRSMSRSSSEISDTGPVNEVVG